MKKGPEAKLYNEHLRELGMSSLMKRTLRSDMIVPFQYLEGLSWGKGGVLSEVPEAGQETV